MSIIRFPSGPQVASTRNRYFIAYFDKLLCGRERRTAGTSINKYLDYEAKLFTFLRMSRLSSLIIIRMEFPRDCFFNQKGAKLILEGICITETYPDSA